MVEISGRDALAMTEALGTKQGVFLARKPWAIY